MLMTDKREYIMTLQQLVLPNHFIHIYWLYISFHLQSDCNRKTNQNALILIYVVASRLRNSQCWFCV